ncbi:Rrf2 family transcriptional regulator [bacterium]|nr:Rrf2 family transcriptional regulator [bacterium]
MITKTSELAVQILMYVASRPNREIPVPPKQIADASKASPSYIAKVASSLVRAGILRAHRGAMGGVTLAAQPEKLTLFEIVETSQGRILADYCDGHFELDKVCNWHKAMHQLYTSTVSVLKRWTLADLLAKPAPDVHQHGDSFCRLARSGFDWLKLGDMIAAGEPPPRKRR